jgi:hypothetical protein
LIGVRRLFEIANACCCQRVAETCLAQTREQKNPDGWIKAFQLVSQFEAGTAWHLEINDGKFWLLHLNAAESIIIVCGGANVMTGASKSTRQSLKKYRIIVDN